MANKTKDKMIETYLLEDRQMHYRLAFSYVKNQEDALDIIQESACKALLSVDSLRDTAQVKSWYCRIIINTSLDFLRKRKRMVVMDEQLLCQLDTGAVDHYSNFDVNQALEQLPEEYRSVIVLRFFEDLKLAEIAEVLQENVSTIKTRLYRSLKLLRLEIDAEEVQ
ncbi:sigma-70 family RNA polymerase sigma factor [Anoxynatronum sibiricum]|uniref:Sigma-70 family RNA polymerase sigma factor n=1 Tax=Anoxynatronum sibiricum TaxID=210623 RepID=A0ABU9VXT1_9CLOT